MDYRAATFLSSALDEYCKIRSALSENESYDWWYDKIFTFTVDNKKHYNGLEFKYVQHELYRFSKQATASLKFDIDFSFHVTDYNATVPTETNEAHSREHGSEPERFTHVFPPKVAELILYFMLPKELRESLPGNLEEEYRTIILPKFGKRAASIWYWKQVFASAAPVVRSRLGKWIAIAWFGKVAAWLTSKLGS